MPQTKTDPNDIAPDGVVYANLRATDRQPSIDLNATLSSAVLPLTGVYYLRAATLKGFGDYRLTFSFGSVAAAPAAQRSIAFAGSVNTVPLNTSVSLQAVMLDPRGYQTSGAVVQFATANGVDDHATVQFPLGIWAYTNTDGVAAGLARPTTVGKAQLTATYTSTLLSSFVLQINTERAEAPIPRYAPVAIAPMRGVSVAEDGSLVTEIGKYESLPVWTPAEPTTRNSSSRRAVGLPAEALARAGEGLAPSHLPAGAAAPALPLPLSLSLSPESISTCSVNEFTLAGVNWAATNPPYTVTLTDEMPLTQPNGIVDALGIHGHRIEKTIRMKIDIKDASGATPPHAVLVNLSLGGPSHGTLILDPDGNRVECSTGSFLWHERDAQGNIIALNEEFEYRLGTYAPYVGAVPDSQNPSVLKPVWGTAEVLGLVVSTVDGTGANLRQPYTYKVKPEPGKPNHFSVSVPPPPSGTPEPVWTYWSDQWLDPPGFAGRTAAGYSTYYLFDHYENLTFGYTNIVPAPGSPVSNVRFQFFDQTAGGVDGQSVEPSAYGYKVQWDESPNGGTITQGDVATTFSITYPSDPDWSGGVVSKDATFRFERGTFGFMESVQNWDCYGFRPAESPCVTEPVPPWPVSPGAGPDAAPRSMANSAPLDAARAVFVIGRDSAPPVYLPPTLSWVETTDNPAFRVSLVDGKGKVATDAKFQVNLCPRYDHFPVNGQPRDCTTGPVPSSGGVIPSVQINPDGPGAMDSQGYMGVELLKAPALPGDYHLKFEALNNAPYRIRGFAALSLDNSLGGEYQGAFAFVTVQAADLLDEDLQSVSPTLNMSVDRIVYVRDVNAIETADSYTIDFVLKDVDTLEETTLQNIAMRRLGRSSVFMTDPIGITSPDPPLAGALSSALETSPVRRWAGIVSPTPGRKDAIKKRTQGGSVTETQLKRAVTRLVEIKDGTPNFDGLTPGDPLSYVPTANPARDHIEVRVKWNGRGYVQARLFNVDDTALFAFDFYKGLPLTTGLRVMRGLPMGAAQFGPLGQDLFLPFSSEPQFKALLWNQSESRWDTVKPGLYRIVAKWGSLPYWTDPAVLDPYCSTDRADHPVCDDSWIVSVGQRIKLVATPGASTDLQTYLTTLGYAGMLPATLLDNVAQDATAKYAAASANVVVTTRDDIQHPFLIETIRATVTEDNDCNPGLEPMACTNVAAVFPMLNPDLDLSARASAWFGGNGINLYAVWHAKMEDDVAGGLADHTPIRNSNTSAMNCGPLNPCPLQVFRNRMANFVAHETAHGFGLTSSQQYTTRSGATASTNAVGFQFGAPYTEVPVSDDRMHESINSPFGLAGSADFLMTALQRFFKRYPYDGDHYDDAVPPTRWVIFDRPLRFSFSSDYTALFSKPPDASVQRFFRERVPVCDLANSHCH